MSEKLTLQILEQMRETKREGQECAAKYSTGRRATGEELEPIFRHHGFLERWELQLFDAASFGIEWRENSSLERWFPITAEELVKLKERNRELELSNKRFLHVRKLPDYMDRHPAQLEICVTVDCAAAEEMPLEELLTYAMKRALREIKDLTQH